jgi:hypothetical protein
MKHILSVPGGQLWQEIETQQEADRASEASATAIRDIFDWERAAGGRGRFVQLTDAEGKGVVWGRLPDGGAWESDRNVMVVGGPIFTRPLRMPLIFAVNSADPFPTYQPAIEALGTALGIRLDESSYTLSSQTATLTSDGDTGSPTP